MHYIYVLSWHVGRDVTKISNCQVNTTSGRGIKQLGIPFGSVFLLFSYATSRGKSPAHSSQWQLCLDFIHVVFAPIDQCRDFKNNFMVLLALFHLPPWKWWGIILIFLWAILMAQRYHGNENFHFKSEYSLLRHTFFMYNNLRQLLLPAKRKKVLYVIMITASRD